MKRLFDWIRSYSNVLVFCPVIIIIVTIALAIILRVVQ